MFTDREINEAFNNTAPYSKWSALRMTANPYRDAAILDYPGVIGMVWPRQMPADIVKFLKQANLDDYDYTVLADGIDNCDVKPIYYDVKYNIYPAFRKIVRSRNPDIQTDVFMTVQAEREVDWMTARGFYNRTGLGIFPHIDIGEVAAFAVVYARHLSQGFEYYKGSFKRQQVHEMWQRMEEESNQKSLWKIKEEYNVQKVPPGWVIFYKCQNWQKYEDDDIAFQNSLVHNGAMPVANALRVAALSRF